MDNDSQTPHFVSQGTGRELFVDDVKKLDVIRKKPSVNADAEQCQGSVIDSSLVSVLRNPVEVLERTEEKFASKQMAQGFISGLFDDITKKATVIGELGDIYSLEIVIHPDYQESTTRAFIIRVLSREKRPDNFVSAAITHERRRRDPWGLAGMVAAASMLWGSDEVVENYALELNCTLEKAQIRVTLTPRFTTLKRLVLVVSCAPSLEVCYVMEMLTRHSLKDWGVFETEGDEVVRRWYKLNWEDSTKGIVEKIWDKIRDDIQQQIDTAVKTATDLV